MLITARILSPLVSSLVIARRRSSSLVVRHRCPTFARACYRLSCIVVGFRTVGLFNVSSALVVAVRVCTYITRQNGQLVAGQRNVTRRHLDVLFRFSAVNVSSVAHSASGLVALGDMSMRCSLASLLPMYGPWSVPRLKNLDPL